MKVRLSNGHYFARKSVVFFTFIIAILIIFGAFLSVLARFKPVFEEKSAILAKARATEIINSAVLDVFSGIESEEYVNIIKKDTGEISFISADSVKMNKLKAIISQAVLEKTDLNESFYIHIPVGSLTKYPVLQGVGYRIPVKVSLDGVTKTEFEEQFTSAGINQVKNRIYVIVSARISIISSFMTISEEVSTQIPLSETIVIGDVPEYYGDKLGVVGR